MPADQTRPRSIRAPTATCHRRPTSPRPSPPPGAQREIGARPASLLSRRALAIGAAALALAGPARAAEPGEEVFESPYNYIIVRRTGRLVSFRRMENGATLSAIDLDRPAFQIVPYTRFLFLAALVAPRPENVLSIGLGAGAFNRLFNLAFPRASLTSVEIDPMIERVAETETGFRQTPTNQVVIEDGRRYLRRETARWDWIVMDAYVRHSQIPPHLTTVEFFDLVRRHLAPGGVFIVNIVAPEPLFLTLLASLRQVFPRSAVFETGNRIFVGSDAGSAPLLGPATALDASALKLLVENDVDLDEMRPAELPVDIPDKTPVLTDDYSPTEYLGSDWGKR